LSKTYETLVGGLLPQPSLFVLTLVNGSSIRITDATLSWSQVAVPEETIGAHLLAVVAAFALMILFGPLTRFRKSDA
jgi:hypothetical protein